MITIKDLVNCDCDLCQKTKDCYVTQLGDPKGGDTMLCLKCLDRQARMKIRSMKPRSAPEPKPAKPESKPEVKPAEVKPPIAAPVNGPAVVAK